MLHTVLDRLAESPAECMLGYSRVVNNVAAIIAHQPQPWASGMAARERRR